MWPPSENRDQWHWNVCQVGGGVALQFWAVGVKIKTSNIRKYISRGLLVKLLKGKHGSTKLKHDCLLLAQRKLFKQTAERVMSGQKNYRELWRVLVVGQNAVNHTHKQSSTDSQTPRLFLLHSNESNKLTDFEMLKTATKNNGPYSSKQCTLEREHKSWISRLAYQSVSG